MCIASNSNMKNIKFSEQIEIDASQIKVFDYTQDYSSRLNWDTFLIKAKLTGAQKKQAKL